MSYKSPFLVSRDSLSENEYLIERYYDQYNNLVKELSYESESLCSTNLFEYDTNNNLIKSDYNYPEDHNKINVYEYDSEGKLLNRTDYDEYEYDRKNQEVHTYEYFPNGKLSKSTFLDKTFLELKTFEYRYYQYDSNWNNNYFYTLWKTLDHGIVLRFIVKYNYDDNGNCLVQSSYHGEQYPDWTEDKELKDLILELIDNGKSSIEPKCFEKEILNGKPFHPEDVVKYKYDSNGNKISSVWLPVNHRSSFEDNDNNLKIKSTHLDGISWSIHKYKYDEKNRLIKQINIHGDDNDQRKKDYIENINDSSKNINFYIYKNI